MRNFGNPYIDPLVNVAKANKGVNPSPLPKPTGPAPYRLNLANVLPADKMEQIKSRGRIAFHMVGDTGGGIFPIPQRILAANLVKQLSRSSFLYILGDITYYTGDVDKYYAQFYAPFQHYTAPIFSIPGNHDGTTQFLLSSTGEPSLTAWMRTFCAPQPIHQPEADDVNRDAMTQPNCYFTLETPYANIVGLYSNTPEGGYFGDEQLAWFVNELRTLPTNKALIVTVHHSPYSLDTSHGSSTTVQDFLNTAITKTGRMPSMVLSGHTHNYQRFTKFDMLRQVPYVVVGTGGYFDLYNVRDNVTTPYNVDGQLVLEKYQTSRHGFLSLTVDKNNITGEYYTIPKPWEPWNGDTKLFDSFMLNWHAGVMA